MTNEEIKKLTEEYLKTNKITKIPPSKNKSHNSKTFQRKG